jgi:hypothetical protein
MDVIKVYTTEYCCDGSLERWTCDDEVLAHGPTLISNARTHQQLSEIPDADLECVWNRVTTPTRLT